MSDNKRPRKSAEDWKQYLNDCVAKGMTQSEVAEELGISPSAICRRAKTLDITGWKKGGRQKGSTYGPYKKSVERIARAEALLAEGMRKAQVAEALGMTKASFYSLCTRYALDGREASHAD